MPSHCDFSKSLINTNTKQNVSRMLPMFKLCFIESTHKLTFLLCRFVSIATRIKATHFWCSEGEEGKNPCLLLHVSFQAHSTKRLQRRVCVLILHALFCLPAVLSKSSRLSASHCSNRENILRRQQVLATGFQFILASKQCVREFNSINTGYISGVTNLLGSGANLDF